MHLKKIGAGLFSITIFAACAWYLYVRVSWSASISVLLSADLRWLLGAGGISIVGYIFVRALRWQAIVTGKAARSSFIVTYFVTAIGIGLALVSPGQVGEALKIELMKRNNNLGRWIGAGAMVVERVIDMFVVGTIAMIGLIIYSRTIDLENWIGPIAIAAVIGLCIFGALILTQRAKFTTTVRQKLRHAMLDPGTLARVIALSLVGWIIVGLGWEAALKSIGVNLAPAQTIWLVAIVIVAVIASLIPGGLGASEVVIVELLSLWGYNPEQALAGAIALRVYGLLVIFIALLHFVLWRLLARKLELVRTQTGREAH